MYRALGESEKLTMVEDDTVHRSTRKNRETMYAFFQQYLKNPGSPEDMDVELLPQEELWVTETGQVKSALKGESVFSLNRELVEKQMESIELKRADYDEHLEKLKSTAARLSGFKYPDKFGDAVFSGRYVNPEYQLEKYLLEGSGDYVLPVVLFKPNVGSRDEVLLILDSEGMDHAANESGLIHELLAEGHPVLLADLPGIGSMGPGYLKGDSYIDSVSYNQWFAAVLSGGSNVGLRAEDIVRLVHFAKQGPHTFSDISALAIGPLGSELLHAAIFDQNIGKIGMVRPFLGYADIATTRFYEPEYIPFTVPGALDEYDLPDLMAGLCPREVFILEPVSGDGLFADEVKAKNSTLFPSRVYSEKGVPDNFRLMSNLENQHVHEVILKVFLK
jgi:hypothetical protein